MSSQDASGIPLSASHSHEALKLIELPADLQQLLESDNPPTLQLKPSEPAAANHPGFAVLCAGDKTYRIQQKSSSNPLMLLRPATTTDASELPTPSLLRVAVLGDTLELSLEATNAAPPKARKWHEKFAQKRSGAS